MVEILVNYLELVRAIETMNTMQKGTGYYSTGELIQQSNGKMFEETNLLYAELCKTEERLIEIIRKTKEALQRAGIDFESAENTLKNYYQSVNNSSNQGSTGSGGYKPVITGCDVPLYGQKTNYTCGSASGSMILNSLGIAIAEDEFWKYSNANGQGTYVYRVTQTLNHYIGSKVYSYVQTGEMSTEEYYQTIKKSLENGYPVEVVIKFSKDSEFGYKSGGHYVVVTGVYQNEAGEYIAKINDPYSSAGVNNPQQLEVPIAKLQKYNANHSGYIICNK